MSNVRQFWIADAHADSLMWNRDLAQRSDRGHVDFERLRSAGVGLQCFTLVTRAYPWVDGFSAFAAWHGWPKHARSNPWERALFQVEQLERFCRASAGTAAITRTSEELAAHVEEGILSALLGVEGAHALEGRVERVGELHAKGVRFMGLVHLSNNELGGSGFLGMGNRPITPLGRQVLDAMGEYKMAVDVAHASERTLEALLEHPVVRPFCSHAGVAALSSPWRNLSDPALRRIADRGGVVGIIFSPFYVGGRGMDAVVRHIRHALDVMGEDGVAFGSDFDGMAGLPRQMKDASDLPKLVDALLQAAVPERVVEKVAGLNLRRFFLETLPRRTSDL